MQCKYCHENTHYIDNCPTILCKICKEIGHPQWLCKLKKTSKNNIKKYSFSEDLSKKNIISNSPIRNINYYLKLENKLWSDL